MYCTDARAFTLKGKGSERRGNREKVGLAFGCFQMFFRNRNIIVPRMRLDYLNTFTTRLILLELYNINLYEFSPCFIVVLGLLEKSE